MADMTTGHFAIAGEPTVGCLKGETPARHRPPAREWPRQRIHYRGLRFMEPKQLSQELRQGKNPNMTRRRAIISLSMLGGSMGQLTTLTADSTHPMGRS